MQLEEELKDAATVEMNYIPLDQKA
jgi:hypothetical protein